MSECTKRLLLLSWHGMVFGLTTVVGIGLGLAQPF